MPVSGGNSWRRTSSLPAVLLACSLLCCLSAEAQSDPQAAVCRLRVQVWLTPDVPDSRSSGFLSSLAGRPGYSLTWVSESQQDMSVTLELSGPGPEYRCRREIERVRRDARVIDLKVLRE